MPSFLDFLAAGAGASPAEIPDQEAYGTLPNRQLNPLGDATRLLASIVSSATGNHPAPAGVSTKAERQNYENIQRFLDSEGLSEAAQAEGLTPRDWAVMPTDAFNQTISGLRSKAGRSGQQSIAGSAGAGPVLKAIADSAAATKAREQLLAIAAANTPTERAFRNSRAVNLPASAQALSDPGVMAMIQKLAGRQDAQEKAGMMLPTSSQAGEIAALIGRQPIAGFNMGGRGVLSPEDEAALAQAVVPSTGEMDPTRRAGLAASLLRDRAAQAAEAARRDGIYTEDYTDSKKSARARATIPASEIARHAAANSPEAVSARDAARAMAAQNVNMFAMQDKLQRRGINPGTMQSNQLISAMIPGGDGGAPSDAQFMLNPIAAAAQAHFAGEADTAGRQYDLANNALYADRYARDLEASTKDKDRELEKRKLRDQAKHYERLQQIEQTKADAEKEQRKYEAALAGSKSNEQSALIAAQLLEIRARVDELDRAKKQEEMAAPLAAAELEAKRRAVETGANIGDVAERADYLLSQIKPGDAHFNDENIRDWRLSPAMPGSPERQGFKIQNLPIPLRRWLNHVKANLGKVTQTSLFSTDETDFEEYVAKALNDRGILGFTGSPEDMTRARILAEQFYESQ